MEYADADALYTNPSHPYTHALISAIPIPDPKVKRSYRRLEGDVASPIHPPAGCRFHTRCPHVIERCKIEEPQLVGRSGLADNHLSACHRVGEI
jgi:oligopeptide/dipeptide ABC transporter ATP-binding protein